MTPIIDAHCHASPVWFEPVEPLVLQMDLHGVVGAVLTQALGQFDNVYQEGCLARYPGRFASVVGIAPDDPQGPAALRSCAQRGAVGLRIRPEARTPGDDPLAIWKAAADCGMAISVAGAPAHVLSPEFAALLRAFPGMTFVLEHLGGWTRGDCDRSDAVRSGIMRLADHANVQLKVPALGQLSPRDMRGRLPASGCVLDPGPAEIVFEALAAFGAERLMWGSDYPPVSSREGYGNALGWMRDLFAARAPQAVAAVFGETAARTFRLG